MVSPHRLSLVVSERYVDLLLYIYRILLMVCLRFPFSYMTFISKQFL